MDLQENSRSNPYKNKVLLGEAIRVHGSCSCRVNV